MKESLFILQVVDRVLDFALNFFSISLAYQCAMIWYRNNFLLQRSIVLLIAALMSVICSFLYGAYNVYKPMRTQGRLYFISRIFLVNMLIAGIGTALILLFKKQEYPHYLAWLFWSEGLSLFLLALKKVSLMTFLRRLRSMQRNIKYILLVTDSREMANSYLEEIEANPHFGYSVIGYVGDLNIDCLLHLGMTADLDRIIKEFCPDEVVMAFETVRKGVITRYVDVCNDNCCKVLFVPAICGYFRAPRQVTGVGNLPLIDIRSNPLDNPANRLLKRGLDVIGSLILILLTAPLMILIALGVRISSPGPILFRQTRVGKNNRLFTMYKFRSMRVNDSEQTGWSHEGDTRKTRFGALIRRLSLDELPQFFNVLKGDMSLVGPRPEVPFYVEKFKKEIPLYMLKHTLRPGITGLAQIKGLRGDTSIAARIEEDINYIEHWSIWRDIGILLLTPFRAVNRREGYRGRSEETRHEKERNQSKGS